jgi:tetratricopeptide (TPR) repeat protein
VLSDQSQYQVGDVGLGAIVLQGENLSITGFTAAQVQQLVQAERDGLVQQYTSQLVELSEQLGETKEAVRTMLHIAGQDDVPPERWRDTLIAIATQFHAMRQALIRPADGGKETAELRRRAISALDAGVLDDATRLLNDIRARERVASEQRRHQADEARAEWLVALRSEAETCTLLARAALARRDAADAAAQFEEGLQVLAPADPPERWSYAMKAAAALNDFGDHAGRNDALTTAIVIYRRALADASRERVPLDWAATQNDLGNALSMLGARERDTARLEEAVVAYRAALEERTRERVPLDWAMTQNNLANVFSMLGERESGTARLEEAVVACRAALEEWTRDRVPLYWAMTQNNLGLALWRLGERESGTARLQEAVDAYRAALEERTRDRVPLQWAGTQNNLGIALETLGERESNTTRLQEAVGAYRAAL